MIIFQLRRAARKINLFERHEMVMQSADVSLAAGDIVVIMQKKGDGLHGNDWYEILCSRGIFWVQAYALCWDTLEV